MREGAAGRAATTFTWDVYLFGAESGAPAGTVNLSSLTADQDFSSPDGLVFSKSTGICWIQTDDGAYTDVTNCMMLAAVPGKVGDGAKKTLTLHAHGGHDAERRHLRRQDADDRHAEALPGRPGGLRDHRPVRDPGRQGDLRQHPAPRRDHRDGQHRRSRRKYTSQWPSNVGYGAGKRPRSATIVITKNDGGRIGT